MLGALIALLSSVSFSLNAVLIRRGVSSGTPAQGTFVTVLIGVPMFVIAALISGQILHVDRLSTEAYAYLAAAGVVHFVIGRSFNYRAIGAIGAARTAPLQSLTIPYSIFIAWVFLGESVSLVMAIGIALIMAGPAILVERGARTPAAVPAGAIPATPPPAANGGIELRMVEGYTASLLSSIAYGTSPILIRAALAGESGVSILGGLVSYVAAGAFVLATLVVPERRELVRSLHPQALRMFFWAGFSVFLAQLLRFLALSLASVAVVSSMMRTGSVFTLAMSWGFNRSLESITWRVVLGVILSVAGGALLVFEQGK